MGKLHSALDDHLRAFIAGQRMFFVATAPSGDEGHVNCSPKGLDTFRVLDAHTVAYLDFTGSGVETIAHLRQNGRIVIMFCAFEGPPNILRLHGRGTVILRNDPAFAQLASHFPVADAIGVRSIIRIDVERISDSCGFGVPAYTFQADREQLPAWASRKGEEGIAEYQRTRNAKSIDDLPGLGD